jgi:hypothetical protein
MSDRRLQYSIRFCSILKQPEKAIGEARAEQGDLNAHVDVDIRINERIRSLDRPTRLPTGTNVIRDAAK